MTEFVLSGGAILGLMPETGIVSRLGPVLPDPPLTSGGPRSELYLVTSKALPFISRAIALGAGMLSSPQRREWGHSAAYFLDPDSLVLALAELSLALGSRGCTALGRAAPARRNAGRRGYSRAHPSVSETPVVYAPGTYPPSCCSRKELRAPYSIRVSPPCRPGQCVHIPARSQLTTA